MNLHKESEYVQCDNCGGMGWHKAVCPNSDCRGSGRVLEDGELVVCKTCWGRGWIQETCVECEGRAVVPRGGPPY